MDRASGSDADCHHEQERREDQQRAISQATLTQIGRTEERLEAGEFPAIDADCEALANDVGQPNCPDDDQDTSEQRVGFRPRHHRQRQEQQYQDGC